MLLLAHLKLVMVRVYLYNTPSFIIKVILYFITYYNKYTVYSFSRRILIAEYQKIVFTEYIQTIFNADIISYFRLQALPLNQYTTYDPEVNPSTILSAGVATFRFPHSTISSQFLIDEEVDPFGYKLRDKYFETSNIWDGDICAFDCMHSINKIKSYSDRRDFEGFGRN